MPLSSIDSVERRVGYRKPGEGAGNKRYQNADHFLIWKHMENTSSEWERDPLVGGLR